MKKSFAGQPAPVLAGVVKERGIYDSIAAIKNCEYHGAGCIDLHLSSLDEEARTVEGMRRILREASVPVLALDYAKTYDHKAIECTEEERVEHLLRAVEAGADAVDMQGYTYDLYSKSHFRREYAPADCSFAALEPKEVVYDPAVIDRQTELIARIHAMGAQVLISTHPGVVMNTEQVTELALHIEKRQPDVIKIITKCTCEEELVESFRTIVTLKKEVRTPVVFHCSGKAGRLSRLVNPMLGSYLAFCCDGYTPSSLFEMPDLQTARLIVDNLKKTL